MKFKRIIRKNPNLKVLMLLVTMISCVSISASYILLPGSPEYNSNTPDQEEFKDFNYKPFASPSDFDTATKLITKGSQQGIYNESNIVDDDGILDSTGFEQGGSFSHIKEDPTFFFGGLFVNWGTNNGGVGAVGDIANALRNAGDNNNLWCQAQTGINYPAGTPGNGWVWMRWGGYSNIPNPNVHPHIYRVRIVYGVWVDYLLPATNGANLRLWAFNNDEEPLGLIQTIDPTPMDLEYTAGVWTIDSATNPVFMASINNGGYIKEIAVDINLAAVVNPLIVYTWINVDFIDIIYDFYKYDVDFTYQLDFSSYTFGTLSEFDVIIDLAGTKSGLGIYLYNFDTSSYDKILSFTAASKKTKTISTDADNYVSGDKKIYVRCSLEDYFDGNPYTSYFINVDQVMIDLHVPDPPSNVQIDQGVLHILLSWDIPNDYGVPITHYNVYRGQGGIKTLIGSPSTNEFDDTSVTGLVPGIKYYYTITAVSSIGESDNSSEVSGQAYNQPFVEWLSPEENVTIIFGMGTVIFNFTYDSGFVDDIELVINGTGPYNVTGTNSTALIWSDSIRGIVNATLFAYNNSVLVAQHSRRFNFVRIIFEREDLFEEKTKVIGDVLYLILHDPAGDNSYSYFTETTQFSIGVGASFSSGVTEDSQLGLELDFGLFGLGLGGSTKATETTTVESGFDFRLEISSTTGLTSNLDTLDPDFIGPGYGDAYWGESWLFRYLIKARYRIYSNGTDRYEEPRLYWGIIRSSETITNDYNAPQSWYDHNPVHDNYNDVTWIQPGHYADGGFEYTDSVEISATVSNYLSFQIQTEENTRSNIFGIGEDVTIELNTKAYVELGAAHIFEAGYTILDDNPSDTIVQDIGVDLRSGTYIFKTVSAFSRTSNPLEHNTFDYVPPVIEFPNIDLDTDDDTFAPDSADTPTITVDIFDEGGISDAIIWYSTTNGTLWDIVDLVEQPGNPGTWEASLPAKPVNTTVMWYIQAWDLVGKNSTRMDVTGFPFEYTVVEEPFSKGTPPGISGFPLVSIIPATILAIIAVVVIYYRKRIC
ncbi:MAG: fibronectin type III domain-containing protein [Promethearchaeota archaeon]